jgi:TPR repeat protein
MLSGRWSGSRIILILWRLVAIDRILEPSTQFPPSLSIPDIFCQTSRMKRLTATICVTIAVLLGSAGVSWSAEFKKGATTYQSGDYLTALREWKPLAEQGDASAQFKLGWMYDNGRGVPQDYKTAVKWYRLSAEQGDASAQFKLGWMYEIGRGVPQNYKTAMEWYTLAAEQGNDNAQFNLGVMYYNGHGVIQDNVYAHMWWNIAAPSGDKDAVKSRDIIAKQMTPSQLEKAQDLARECVRKKYKGC